MYYSTDNAELNDYLYDGVVFEKNKECMIGLISHLTVAFNRSLVKGKLQHY